MQHSIVPSPFPPGRRAAEGNPRQIAPGPQGRSPGGRRRAAGVALSAAALAGASLYVQAKARRAERENPPLGRFVEVDGVRLHYIERGQGQPLVLLHGNGALVQDFALSGLVDLAAQRYRVLVFDRPGYGYSTRPRWRIWTPEAQAKLFVEAFAALGIERPIVLGHSWGSLVAIALGLDYRLTVQGLVLASGYYYPTFRADVTIAATPALPLVGDLMRHTVSPLIARLLWHEIVRKLFAPNPISASFQRFPVWMALRPSQIRAAAEESALMIPAAARLSARYARLDVPTLILAGGGDRIVDTARQSVALAREVAGASLRILPAVGHMIHHIAPGVVLSAIDAVAADAGRKAGRGGAPNSSASDAVLPLPLDVSAATHSAQ